VPRLDRPRPVVGALSRLGVVLALLASALIVAPTVPAQATDDDLRVLVMGDSMTHGSAGDWTWRYRLWQTFRAQHVDVDFVGHRQDVFDNVAARAGSMDYLDPAFDRDHASLWGASLALPGASVSQLVEEYQPDVVVVWLGLNDLTWGAESAEQVQARLRLFVETVRAVDPDVRMVLGHAAHTWIPKVTEFNALVDELGEELPDTAVAEPDEGFEKAADTWDGTHASATGEWKIAAAFVDALADLGYLRPVARPLPSVVNGPRRKPVLSVGDVYGAPTLSWILPPGADTGRLWGRSGTAPWRVVSEHRGNGSVPIAWLDGGLTEFRMQPVKGELGAAEDMFSDAVRWPPPQAPAATPTPAKVTKKPVAKAPRAVKARQKGRKAVVTWKREATATRYRIQLRKGNGAWRSVGWSRTSTWTSGKLAKGKRYSIRVRSYRGSTAGKVSTVVRVRI